MRRQPGAERSLDLVDRSADAPELLRVAVGPSSNSTTTTPLSRFRRSSSGASGSTASEKLIGIGAPA